MFAKVLSYGLLGLEGLKIDVEVDTNLGLPSYDIVGLPDAAVKESKERVRSAIKNSGFKFPTNKITVNLAPANVKKMGANFDLPIAVAILASSNQITAQKYKEFVIIGELGLNGKIKPVNGILPLLISARNNGFKNFIIPKENENEASYIEGITVYAIDSLVDVVSMLSSMINFEPVEQKFWKEESFENITENFARIKGQKIAKRVMEIAVSGGHNILMVGPPGSGKTMIARAVPSIMPSLTFEEALEVTKIHSIAGELDNKKGIVTTRPFRAPHHTASTVSLVGGGRDARPGEVSLASNGVLFLDELPEYPRTALETLRQPLEDGMITVSRASGSFEYPANFMLIASMNPCPCGNYGSRSAVCTCSPSQIQNYLKKLSGPLLDRIDLKVDVDRVDFLDLSSKSLEESSEEIRKRVEAARRIQTERFAGSVIHSNSKMNSKMMSEFCKLSPESEAIVKLAFEKYKMSARGYSRLLKVARTIADLDGSKDISEAHIAEALAYRNIDKFGL